MIERVEPVYPEAMLSQRVIGQVNITCLVTEAGVATEIKAEGKTQPEFVEAATQAIEKCKFSPGRKASKPRAMRVSVPMLFSISDQQLAELEGKRTGEMLPPGPPIRDAAELSDMPELEKEIRPRQLKRDRYTTTVDNTVVSLVVDEQGMPRDVHVLVTTAPECSPPALEAVRQWRFSPGKIEGQIVRVRMEVPISFFSGNPSANGARVRPGVSRDFVTSAQGQPVMFFTGAADEEPPKPLQKTKLKYPEEMAWINMASVIDVDCIINPYGVVTHVRALNAENQFFAIAAERSFSCWRFTPPKKAGKAVYFRGRLRAGFEIIR